MPINSKSIIINSIILIVLITGCLQAQFIIKQVEYTIPISYSLIPEDAEFESEEEEALFFITIPTDKIKQAAIEEGREINTNESTIYVDGDNFTVENNSEMGKMAVISNAKDGVIYMVLWDQKRVIVITAEDIKKMEEQVNKAVEESIKMMSPEMQTQVRAAMEQEKNHRSGAKQIADPTGKKMSVNGFDCELYIIKKEEGGITGIWAAPDDLKISAAAENISEKFSKIFNMGEDEETDEWSLVSGKIPVEVREMSEDMSTGEPGFSITSIQKIERKTPPPTKFHVPGENEGFTYGSYSDMMEQMMQGN